MKEKEALEKAEREASKTGVGSNDSEENSEDAVKGKWKRGADDLDFDDFDESSGRSGEWSGLGAGPAGLDDRSATVASEEEAEVAGILMMNIGLNR